MAELKKAQLKLWIYEGDVNSVPTTPDYTLTKTKLSTESIVVFEISELIKDYIKVEFDGDYQSLKQTRFVKAEITRTYDTTPETTDTYTEHYIAFRGYGDITDGINPELSKDLLISNTVINNYCGEELSVPFYTRDDGTTKVKYIQDQQTLSTVVLGSAAPYTIAQSTNLAPANDVVKIDKTASTVSSPDESSSSTVLPLNTTKITYTDSKGEEKSINVECIDECRNTPYKISFINKFGVMQDIWFFARRKDSISSTREDYKKTTLKIGSTDVSYDTSDHQIVYLENQGKERMIMNTGFIHDSYGEVMKQLLVSEYVYIHDQFRRSPSNPIYDLAVPINVVTNSLDIKTRRDDKLINYELQFEMDSQFIQSVL
jgi:hypothetical protein